jgi:hypothetical protein
MTDTPVSVISGVPYPVTSVGGAAPSGLDAFLGETSFTIDMAGRAYDVKGAGSDLEGVVRFHEKSDTVGKDVRVWHVTREDDGFRAVHVAAF